SPRAAAPACRPVSVCRKVVAQFARRCRIGRTYAYSSGSRLAKTMCPAPEGTACQPGGRATRYAGVGIAATPAAAPETIAQVQTARESTRRALTEIGRAS